MNGLKGCNTTKTKNINQSTTPVFTVLKVTIMLNIEELKSDGTVRSSHHLMSATENPPTLWKQRYHKTLSL